MFSPFFMYFNFTLFLHLFFASFFLRPFFFALHFFCSAKKKKVRGKKDAVQKNRRSEGFFFAHFFAPFFFALQKNEQKKLLHFVDGLMQKMSNPQHTAFFCILFFCYAFFLLCKKKSFAVKKKRCKKMDKVLLFSAYFLHFLLRSFF